MQADSPIVHPQGTVEPWLTQHRLNQFALVLFAISLALAFLGTRGLTTQDILSLL